MNSKTPSAFTVGIRDNGTVEGHRVETYYRHCEAIATDHKLQCLRVVADDGGVNIETRVLFSTLIAEGWVPPSTPNARS